MKNTSLFFAALFAGLTLAPLALAQDASQPAAVAKAPEHFYKITFVVQELNAEGKAVNSRSYTTSVSTKAPSGGSIRTGTRLPIVTSSSSGSDSVRPLNVQYQYIDLGINFDIHDVQEVGNRLAMGVKAEISSAVAPSQSKLPAPVVSNNRWDSPVLLPIGKATTIFTSDSIDSKGAMQVVATATPLE